MRENSIGINYNIKGQEIYSRYATEELLDRLRRYNNKDTLIMLDVDDTLRDSPAKKAAWQCLDSPTLWMHRQDWVIDQALIIMSKLLKGEIVQDAEADCFEYCMNKILPNYPGLIEELLEVNWTPLYSGVKEVVGFFCEANKIIVLQNVEQVVYKTVQELDLGYGYFRVSNKLRAIKDYCKGKRLDKFLVIANSKQDYDVGRKL